MVPDLLALGTGQVELGVDALNRHPEPLAAIAPIASVLMDFGHVLTERGHAGRAAVPSASIPSFPADVCVGCEQEPGIVEELIVEALEDPGDVQAASDKDGQKQHRQKNREESAHHNLFTPFPGIFRYIRRD